MKKIREYKYPLTGFLIGLAVGLAIEFVIIKSGKSGNLFIAAQYLQRTGLALGAMDGAIFGGLIGFLLKLARARI